MINIITRTSWLLW